MTPTPSMLAEPHIATVANNETLMRCTCGVYETVTEAHRDRMVTAEDIGRGHVAAMVDAVVPTLPVHQFAAALREGASTDSALTAAVELLIAHDHWIWFGYLRRYVVGGWNTRTGALYLRIKWGDVRRASGEAHRIAGVLRNVYRAPANVVDPVNRLAESTDADAIFGSTSEMAILRLAASIAGHGSIDLGDALGSLGDVNRSLALTAIGHYLTQGGTRDRMHAAPHWHYTPTDRL